MRRVIFGLILVLLLTTPTLAQENQPTIPESVILQHEDRVSATQWSADSTRILTSDRFGIYIWDSFTGELLETVVDNSSERREYETVVWNDAETRVLTVAGNTVQIFGENPITVTHEYGISQTMWNADNSLILAITADNQILIISPDTGEILQTLQHENTIQSAQWSPSGNDVLTVSFSTAYLWNALTGELIRDFPREHSGRESIIGTWLDNERFLLWKQTKSSLATPDVAIVSVQTGEVMASASVETDRFSSGDLAIIPNSGLILYGNSLLGITTVLNPQLEVIFTLTAEYNYPNHQGDYYATLSDDEIRIIETDNFLIRNRIATNAGRQQQDVRTNITWNFDDTRFLYWNSSSVIIQTAHSDQLALGYEYYGSYEYSDRDIVADFQNVNAPLALANTPRGTITSLLWSPDGTRLFSWGACSRFSGCAYVLDTETGQLVYQSDEPLVVVNATISPDGEWFIYWTMGVSGTDRSGRSLIDDQSAMVTVVNMVDRSIVYFPSYPMIRMAEWNAENNLLTLQDLNADLHVWQDGSEINLVDYDERYGLTAWLENDLIYFATRRVEGVTVWDALSETSEPLFTIDGSSLIGWREANSELVVQVGSEIQRYNALTGDLVQSIDVPSVENASKYIISNDENTLFYASDGILYQVDFQQETVNRLWSSSLLDFELSTDNSHIAAWSGTRNFPLVAAVIDVSSGEIVHAISPGFSRGLYNDGLPVAPVSWSPDNVHLMVWGEEQIQIWDITTGTFTSYGYVDALIDYQWNPDGSQIAIREYDAVFIWNITN